MDPRLLGEDKIRRDSSVPGVYLYPVNLIPSLAPRLLQVFSKRQNTVLK